MRRWVRQCTTAVLLVLAALPVARATVTAEAAKPPHQGRHASGFHSAKPQYPDGKVRVHGYRRHDATYVKPYTRRYPHKKA